MLHLTYALFNISLPEISVLKDTLIQRKNKIIYLWFKTYDLFVLFLPIEKQEAQEGM